MKPQQQEMTLAQEVVIYWLEDQWRPIPDLWALTQFQSVLEQEAEHEGFALRSS